MPGNKLACISAKVFGVLDAVVGVGTLKVLEPPPKKSVPLKLFSWTAAGSPCIVEGAFRPPWSSDGLC